ncbi:bifunctional folylpolyglutamate synthase/dihydrofolate synthase [Ascoidea rubescens DSM 1968]|uniref:Dihydrofolate synthetase n=1 Tax=Ascoidea rubescens DSM 1968 TaxID=1344418 RepID=A0A1D2V9V8_9ASCO|nr:FolC bifunctional protein [Ascoidea rubescens DSM 1968]ODV58418.1 FolC bifunctional protein [Ascoidea rubescens DSM 1968]
MPIDLSLQRVVKLLGKLGNPHLSNFFTIHIAGTNGKGSVCSYLSSILKENKFRIGKFTSPFLINRYDCISINNEPVNEIFFLEIEKTINRINLECNIRATEFEILTVIAFKIFELKKINFAILEVGLGGKLDATNNSDNGYELVNGGVILTGITKIDYDHENILGKTLSEISEQKAGIIKEKVKCVLDGSNKEEVIKKVREISESQGSKLYITNNDNGDRMEDTVIKTENFGEIPFKITPLLGRYQYQNLSISLKIIDLLYPYISRLRFGNGFTSDCKIKREQIIEGIKKVKWPARLQTLDLCINKEGERMRVLVDGAHNGSAAVELGQFIDKQYRQKGKKIVFVMSVTNSKKIESLVMPLFQREDRVFLTRFDYKDGVDQMPWISSYKCSVLKQKIERVYKKKGAVIPEMAVEENLEKLLEQMQWDREREVVVVCGSLYLASALFRIHLEHCSDGTKDIF